MKKKFTILMALFALMLITLPGMVKGQSTTYTSNVTFPSVSSPLSTCTVVINNSNYDGIKIGTSGTKTGSFNITIPSGTTKLYVHAAAWNGKSSTLSVTTKASGVSITPNSAWSLTADSGISGNSTTYTLATPANASTSYFKEYTLSGVNSNTTITIANGVERAVIWGVNYEIPSPDPSCEITPTSWAIGDVQAGSSTQTQEFTVTASNLQHGLSFSIDNQDYYWISNSVTGMGSNETSKTIEVTFNPEIVGAMNDVLRISGDDFENDITVNLTANGLCNAPTNALAYATPVNLTLSGDEVEYTLNPTANTGNGGTITYAMKTNPGQNGMVEGNVFTAVETGTYVVTATQAVNGTTCGGTFDITINVHGVDPVCTVDPEIWDFETVAVGESANKTFTVTTANLTGNVSLAMTDDAFTVSPSTIQQNAASTEITITFTPSEAGKAEAYLTANGGGISNNELALVSGTGATPLTITFNAGTGSCATPSMSGLAGSSITLPTASPSSTCATDGWTFAGWATAAVASETTTAPDPLYAAGASYTIGNADVTLYAVYKLVNDNSADTDNVFESGSYSNSVITWTINNVVSIKQEQNGSGNTAPNSSFVSSPRWYSGNKITITPSSTINYITVTANTESYATALANSTYTNASASAENTTVTITPTNGNSTITIVMGGQSRLSSLTVNYGSSSTTYFSSPNCLEKVATPEFTVAAGTYTSVQSVEITCATTGATIKYKTTENGEWQNYNEAISVGENMTIWAKAVKADMADSDEVSAAYVINLPLTTMDAIYAKATANGDNASNVNVVFDYWVVSGVGTGSGNNPNNVFVTDNNGKGFIIYKSGHGFAVNNKLSGSVNGTPLKLYNNAAEFTNLTSTTEGLTVTNDGSITVIPRAITELSGINTGSVVTINNVRFDGTYLKDASNNEIKPYNLLYAYGSALQSDHVYNVTGVYLQYGETKEICPRSGDDIEIVTYPIIIDSEIEHGTVTAAASAEEGATVTLTITPDATYALKTLSVYKTGDESTVVSTTNPFTMPAYGVTVTAEFGKEYSVKYYRNAVANDETAELKYGEGSDVTVLNYDDDNVDFELPEGKLFVNWNTQSDGSGTPYEVDDQIENIDANYDLYAQWRDIVYHITYSVNGTLSDPVDVAYGGNIATLPTPSLSPLTFLGWSTTSAIGPVNVTAPYAPTGTTENITLYAVFGAVSTSGITITPSSTNMPSGYPSSETEYSLEGFKFKLTKVGVYNSLIQMQASNGTMYNTDGFGKITSIVLNYDENSTNQYNITIKGGDTQSPLSGTVITPDENTGDVRTYDFSGYNYSYFYLKNGSGAAYLSSIVINYEASIPVTVTTVTGTQDMDEIAANTSVVVKKDAVLTFTGTNTDAAKLIIEDGGQLVTTNSVKATMKKTTIKSEEATRGDAVNNWYAISSPVNNVAISSFVKGTHNVYRYDEPKRYWHEYRKPLGDSLAFDKLRNGCGYLYRSTENGIEFQGSTIAEATYTLSYNYLGDDMQGFNLIGNPFTHNIYKGTNGAIENTQNETVLLEDGFYVLLENGGWDAKEDNTDAIAPTQAILVQATSSADGETLTITDKTTGYVDPNSGDKYGNDRIMFSVKNSEYSDNSYVLFKKGRGLSKIEHRNNAIPMLYVTKEGENFAIADMPDNTSVINLGFEAKTIGQYTFSLKAEGQYSYMHLYDKLTGNDVDMLVEDSYTFIGAPSDRKDRFVLNLNYNAGSSTDSETFAYQSGNDIMVSGEGELQVFDVMGRMVMSQRINGVETVNGLNNGVYIFRMEGKTQKIVVR